MVLDTKNMLHIFPMRLSVMKILIMYWVKDNAKLPPSAARIGGKETLGDLQT